MLETTTLEVGQLKTNCYIITDTNTNEGIILDPGDEADFLIQKISDLEIIPTQIIATHCHFDHVMAVNELKLAFNIPFLCNKKDVPLLSWMRKSAVHFTGFDPGPPPIPDKFLTNGQKLKIADRKLKVISTPGHTPGSISLYQKDKGVVFSGDTIFANGAIGRWDFPYANKKLLLKSVNKILSLPKNTTIYPGHGEPSIIAKERKNHDLD